MSLELQNMIEEAKGTIEYDEQGSGPTVVLVPGSCSTGAAWRPVIAAWDGQFRTVTTSLLGYGKTSERRTAGKPDIAHNAEAVESVIRHSGGGPVHLVSHSYGGGVALAVALGKQVTLASLVIIECPAMEFLRERNELEHYRTIRQMSEAYFADFAGGNAEAIAAMIDFYGGSGTFASWPPKLRAYVVQTTPVNLLDWEDSCFPLSAKMLENLGIPLLVIVGGDSSPAMQRANALLSRCTPGSTLPLVEDAAHFLIGTHAAEVANHGAAHVHRAQAN
jgi:pimeloyl-ACP methyl ester carboxylesterase